MFYFGNNLPLNDFSSPVRVQFWMLSVPEIYFQLLFGSRVETEVGLIGKIVRMEKHLDEARFRDERLRLFALSAEHSRIFAVANIRLGITVYYL